MQSEKISPIVNKNQKRDVNQQYLSWMKAENFPNHGT